MRSPARGSARSASGTPVRLSIERKPSTASRPLQSCPTARGSPRRPARRAPATAGRRRRRRAPRPFFERQLGDLLERLPGAPLVALPSSPAAARAPPSAPRRAGSRARSPAASASCGPGTGSHSPALQSRTSPSGWAISSGVSCSSGAATRSGGRRGGARRGARSPCAIRWNASQSDLASHGGGIASLNACTNGCRSVEERSNFSYQVAAGSTTSENRRVRGHPKVDRRQQVELALRRLLAPARPRAGAAPAGTPPRARALSVDAEQVLEEVLVPLARGPEQVRAPHRHHLRVVRRARRGPRTRTAAGRLAARAPRTRPGRSPRARPSSTRSSGLRSKLGYDGSHPSRAPSALTSTMWRPG